MAKAAKHVDPAQHRSLFGYLAQRAGVGLIGVLALGLGVAGVMLVVDRTRDDASPQARPACPQHTLSLAADPAIADAISEATTDLSPWLDDGQCLRVDVTAVASAEAAADVARPAGMGLGSTLPDVWVPDSTHWLDVAGATEAGATRLAGADPTPLATSPVVLAVAADSAAAADWPDTQPTWSDLLAADAGEVRLGTPDPQSDTSGLTALLAAGTRPRQISALGRRLEIPSLNDQTPAGLVAAGELDAIPASEADVIEANRADDGSVVAAYDPALDASLDFPLVTLTHEREQPDKRDLATLRKALSSPETLAVLQQAGLRGPDGTLPDGVDESDGVMDEPAPAALAADAGTVDKALRAWSLVGRRSRLLVLVDRSGSMVEPLPGGTDTKSELASQSVARLIDSSAPDSDIGLWTFTTGQGLEGIDTLVDVGRLGEPATTGDGTRRDQLRAALPELAPDPEGGTPLYRAVLEAYGWALDNYAFGRFNAVVVVTDGRDEDTTQTPIPRTELLDTLRQQYDGMRPVPIISLAYGEGADLSVLQEISDVTGGRAYQGLTQAQVTGMLNEALARS